MTSPENDQQYEAVTQRQLHNRLQHGGKLPLPDVRTSAEHAVHIEGVHLVPLDWLDATQLEPVASCCHVSLSNPRSAALPVQAVAGKL